jgi:hypothetical protein
MFRTLTIVTSTTMLLALAKERSLPSKITDFPSFMGDKGIGENYPDEDAEGAEGEKPLTNYQSPTTNYQLPITTLY